MRSRVLGPRGSFLERRCEELRLSFGTRAIGRSTANSNDLRLYAATASSLIGIKKIMELANFAASDTTAFEPFERQGEPGVWSVEHIDDDGGIEQVIFIGQSAERRCREYAGFRLQL